MSKDTPNEQSTRTPEDAILSILGDEKEEEKDDAVQQEGEGEEVPENEVESEEQEKDPVYRVKIDGEEQEVPLSELVKGYQRQADYTRKTQRLADERRKLQEVETEAAAEREAYRRILQSLESQLGGTEPDWAELQARLQPHELAQEMATYQRRTKALQAIKAEQARIVQIEQLRAQEALKLRVEQERELLTAAIPEWVDAETARREKSEIYRYAKENLGFSDEELDSIYDHRAVALLRKAWLYDKGAAKAKEVRQAAKTQTPQPGTRGSVNVSRLKKASERLRQTGSVEDAAAVFRNLL
jgi:hypothetical protein